MKSTKIWDIVLRVKRNVKVAEHMVQPRFVSGNLPSYHVFLQKNSCIIKKVIKTHTLLFNSYFM